MALPLGRTFCDDIAIDLGTANTLVHVAGKGVIIDEPSIVAVRVVGGQREVIAVGQKARLVAGKTPEASEILRPMRDGVIADFIATEEMLRQFIKRAKTMLGFRRPRVVVCVPSGATAVERRAVYETALAAGARVVHMLEEPVAASLGAGLPIDEAAGTMVVDIGGGTTDIAVMSHGEVVQSRSLRLAGNAMDEAIIRYIRRHHHLLVGEANAERIKIEAGSAVLRPDSQVTEIHIRGRDLRQGLQKAVVLTPADIAAALEGSVDDIADFVRRAIEDLPPNVASDACERGIALTGGGALLAHLDEALSSRLGVRVVVAEQPMECVVRGTALALEQLSRRQHLLIRP